MKQDMIAKPDVARLRREVPGLGVVEYYDEIGSTNRRARELAEAGAPDASLVLAYTQSGGRGRFDRRFISPPGGLYFSYIARPCITPDRMPFLTSAAAVAVAEAVEGMTGCEVKIKWVNDLWMNGQKICGILTEGKLTPTGDAPAYAVIGIGLNVRRADLGEELTGVATSVEAACGAKLDLTDMLAAVLNRLAKEMETIADGGHMEAYRRRSALDGREVTVSRGDETYTAYVRGVGHEGELLLRLPDGTETALVSGEVVSVHPAN